MKNIPDIPKEVLVDNLILLGYRGSIAHNMYIPNTDPNSIDDIDIMGVFLAPENFYIGISQLKSKNPQTIEIKKEIDGVLWDCVYYELQHFVKMLLKGNPNVLGMLWLKKNHYLMVKDMGAKLLEIRDAFVTRNVYHSFVGFASDQLKKMEHHQTKGYMGEKRKRLVEKYGYDIKNAAHAIRLLTMGVEFLEDGYLTVYRDPRKHAGDKYLMDIKRGEWALETVKDEAIKLFEISKQAFEASKLPDKPDSDTAELAVMAILQHYIMREEII